MEKNAELEAEIFSAASEPARDDQGRFAQAEREPDPRDTVPAEQERPTPNLGQLPDDGEDEGEPSQPNLQQAPQQDPRQAGMLNDLKKERERRQENERALAERDRKLAEYEGRMRAMEQMFGQFQNRPQQPAQPQQPEPAPDPFADPEGFARHQAEQLFQQRFTPFQQQFEAFQQRQSAVMQDMQRQVAAGQFGADAAREAEEAFNTAAARGAIDPHEHRRINSAPNPYAAAVEWHRRNKALETVGHDPEKWFGSEFERRIQSDPAFRQQVYDTLQGQAQQPQAAGGTPAAAGTRQPVFTGLPSLTNAPGSAGRDPVPLTEADIFNAAPPKIGQRR